MKKSLIILMCGILTIGMLGCGDNSKQTSSADPVENTQSNSTESKETVKEESKEKNIVLLDNEKCKISYTGIDNTGATGGKAKLIVENKTDKKITIQVRDVSLDGEMVEHICSIDVTPGKKSSNNGITVMQTKLNESSKMEGTFVVVTENDFINADKIEFSFEL